MLPVRIESLVRVGAVVHYLQLARLVVVAVPEHVSVVGLGVFNMLARTYINFGILTHTSIFLTPKMPYMIKNEEKKLQKVHLPLPQFTF